MNQADIALIVAQASSLSEHLSNNLFKVDATQFSQEHVSDRLEHWCQVVAQGNWEKFQKRLQWDGLDLDAVRLVLGDVPVEDSQALPTWAQILTEIIQTASEFAFQNESQIKNLKSEIPINPENPLLFEDVLVPSLLVARRKLLNCLGHLSLSPDHLPLKLFSEQAYLSLERSLLQRLVFLSLRTLKFEFSSFRPFGQTLFSLLRGEKKGTPSKAHYNAFVQKLLQDGLLTFFQKYPVLGRLIATSIEFWVEATVEFLQRLEADLSEIQQVFNCSEQTEKENRDSNTYLGKVIEIKPALSDPHNRGRRVIALTFESGLKLVYKPNDLTSEVAYNQFLDWCNQRGIPLPFKIFQVLNRGTHGWVEYVENLPCEDEAAVQRFYQRAGMLLCILYILGGNDCHCNNLIASSEHLVLIDLETLMHPEARVFVDNLATTEANTAAKQQLSDSVLHTMLLPRSTGEDKNSGLVNSDLQQTFKSVLQWNSVNTDDMHLGYKEVPVSVQQNVPILNGVGLSPNQYLDDLVQGFKQMYRFLMEQRDALLADDGCLALFQGQQVRFIFRSTYVYDLVSYKTLAPEFLHSGVDRSIELDILSRAFLTTKDKPNVWPILQAELKAMEQMDIPYFGTASDTDSLILGLEQPIEHYFQESSYSKVIWRLQKLNEPDLAQQVEFIKMPFYARVAQASEIEEVDTSNSLATEYIDFSPATPLTDEQLLCKAQTIAQGIQERAIRGSDGSASWIGLVKPYRFKVMDDSLYSGNCGIAMFLAALDNVTGTSQFRNMALGALQSVQKTLRTSDVEFIQKFVQRIGIGGSSGLGAIIYSFVRISQFLQEAALLEDAQLAANLIVPESIAADKNLDIIHGSAGAILGLLALYNKTGDLTVLDKAVLCGQHLLEHRVSVNNYPKTWNTLDVDKETLTGFAHGATGIAYALVRLYAVTRDNAYLKAACEGIAYERNVFLLDLAANWPNFCTLEPSGQPSFKFVKWCHGAPGIGLARLGGLSILETDEIHQDIELALQTTQKYGLQGVDHLCCGSFGRIELLVVAAQKLSRPDLLETANQWAAWMIEQAEKNGTYQLFPNLPNRDFSAFNPSFFRGTAGIGYELLRLAYPEILPSVLLWE